jgi:hypothetical protein
MLGTSMGVTRTDGAVPSVCIEALFSEVLCETSLGGGFISEKLPMNKSCCFISSVRFTPTLFSPSHTFLISLYNMIFLSFSLHTLTVSCLYACFARNDCNVGFPKRNAQLPPLSNTSNSPLTTMFPICTLPFHTTCDGIIVPFPILNHFLDLPHAPNLCLTFLKIDVHIADTMVHPSKRADTQTISPAGVTCVEMVHQPLCRTLL